MTELYYFDHLRSMSFCAHRDGDGGGDDDDDDDVQKICL